jgi:hypothetical protein
VSLKVDIESDRTLAVLHLIGSVVTIAAVAVTTRKALKALR